MVAVDLLGSEPRRAWSRHRCQGGLRAGLANRPLGAPMLPGGTVMSIPEPSPDDHALPAEWR